LPDKIPSSDAGTVSALAGLARGRRAPGALFISAGVLTLGAYGFVATFQPDPHFGRILAAYRIFVADSLALGCRGRQVPAGPLRTRRSRRAGPNTTVTRVAKPGWAGPVPITGGQGGRPQAEPARVERVEQPGAEREGQQSTHRFAPVALPITTVKVGLVRRA
jgi:hypothetical protein